MSEYIVSYDIAVKLKEKGFPMPKRVIFGIYEDDKSFRLRQVRPPFIQRIVIAPTISLVLRWLREEKQLFVEPSLFKYGYESYVQSTIFEEDKDYTDMWRVEGFHSTYEQAAIAGIEYVLDNLI